MITLHFAGFEILHWIFDYYLELCIRVSASLFMYFLCCTTVHKRLQLSDDEIEVCQSCSRFIMGSILLSMFCPVDDSVLYFYLFISLQKKYLCFPCLSAQMNCWLLLQFHLVRGYYWEDREMDLKFSSKGIRGLSNETRNTYFL